MGLSTRDLESGFDADRGSGSKDHFASTRPRSVFELRSAVLHGSAWDPDQQYNVRGLPAVRSTRETESGSSESGFSARVESPIIPEWCLWQTSAAMVLKYLRLQLANWWNSFVYSGKRITAEMERNTCELPLPWLPCWPFLPILTLTIFREIASVTCCPCILHLDLCGYTKWR